MQGGIRCRLNFYHNLKGSRAMLSLTPRLFACAEAVNGNFACDVGTDHAFLAAYLIQCGKCGHVIASDVADGPLSSAEKTVRELNLEDKISIVKSDGLKNIEKDRITDVIIAGMGGELILKIISECEWLKSGVNLILQPMTKAEYLRKSLFSSGFEIVSEKAV
jgi:tRNA (adenine22-N1)-methyltransferase